MYQDAPRDLRGQARAVVWWSVPARASSSTPIPLENRLAALRGRALNDSELQEASTDVARALLERCLALTTPAERKRQKQLSQLMNDSLGQAFTTCLTDRAYRSREPARIVDVARQLLRTLGVPRYLPTEARAQLQLLLRAGPFVPALAAQGLLKRLREETRGVVLPAEETELRAHLAQRRSEGVSVNVNYLGEAVLGEREAEARLESYEALLARPEVQAISIKLSSIASRVELLAFRESLDELKPRVRRIYQQALAHRFRWPDGTQRPKLVSLDMEAYRDLPLTFALFSELMSEPELDGLQACLVLQAYLPDAPLYQRELTRIAQARMQRGGQPLRLRIVKGANLAAERVESALRGWPLPTVPDKLHADANYKRMLEYACQPEHARAVHLGVASHNLFDVSFALCLSEMHGLRSELTFEVLEGMADALRRALQTLDHEVLVYCPIVEASSMQTAIAYLMRRLDENTAQENFLRSSFGMHVDDPAFQRERERWSSAFELRNKLVEAPQRTQDLAHPQLEPPGHVGRAFMNEPDTDFALPHNERHIRAVLEAQRTQTTFDVPLVIAGQSRMTDAARDGFDPSRPGHVPYRHALAGEREIERALQTASAAAPRFAQSSVKERVGMLHAVARGLRARRAELIACMVLDAGKRIDQADSEVSEAIDFAEYYALSFCEHARRPEYRLAPRGPVVVTPPWNFPLAIPTSGTLAAIMAGNPVILKPALETVLVASRLAEICHEAGVPRDVLQFVVCEDDVGSQLIRDWRVANVILTGATSTARKFYELRPELALLAETGGKNSIIVSDLSDRDLAIKEALASAFGHAGQKCSAASLLICVPEVYEDAGFMEVLRDATASLPVGSAWDPRSLVTPLISPPGAALSRALSSLDPGERFLVEPRRFADNPRLIGPSIKLGVAAGSFSHVTELFGPQLAVMRADDFDHALELANATPYGLTAGLFSLDEREQARWTQRMRAGNLYINRTITGAIVGRQPFGGWKASSFGPGAKAGGPNYVLQLCDVRDGAPEPALEAPEPAAAHLISAIRERCDKGLRERMSRAACQYAQALRSHFRLQHDPSAIIGERNVFRYVPCAALTIRVSADATLEQCLLAAIAAVSSGASPVLSVHPSLSGQVHALPGCRLQLEESTPLCARLRQGEIERLRQLGSLEDGVREAAAESGTHIADAPVLLAGRIELLHYLREQVVSNAYHRYGSLHAAQMLDV